MVADLFLVFKEVTIAITVTFITNFTNNLIIIITTIACLNNLDIIIIIDNLA